MTTQAESGRASAAATENRKKSRRESWPGLLVDLEPGEGRIVCVFFVHAFLLLVCYYVLKTLREPLLLADGSAELKSYAYATVALSLLVLVPIYGFVFRRFRDRSRLVQFVTTFFLVNLAAFCVAGRLGADIGFAYYVWVGIFGVTIVAQFWSYAADVLDVGSGQRLFPAIAAGAAAGGLAGPLLVGKLYEIFGPWNLMIMGAALLSLTLPLIRAARSTPPVGAQSEPTARERRRPTASAADLLGGLVLVLRDRYLTLMALFVVLLNCVNSTGEYLLTNFVLQHADARLALDPTLSKVAIIADFYGAFYLIVNALTLLTQALLVGRAFRWLGVGGALMVLPVIGFFGYGLICIVPLFALVRWLKTIENSADYSVTNTSRNALYLPLTCAAKYEGKLAIDTFFCRFGDLLHAGIIFVGVNWLALEFESFAVVNVVLAAAWLLVAKNLADRFYVAAGRPVGGTERADGRSSGRPGRGRDRLRPVLGLRKAFAAASAAAAFGLLALSIPNPVGAAVDQAASSTSGGVTTSSDTAPRSLFDSQDVLTLDVYFDFKQLCRDPTPKRCHDVAATFAYRDAAGEQRSIQAKVRSRGRYSARTGACQLPALFVYFDSDTAGSIFEGQRMLPLTTHCRRQRPEYERYVLREFLAYRIYNALTDKSLRVRLARITYHDTAGKRGESTHYGFFTEHFESLARRLDAVVAELQEFDPSTADPNELAMHDLFQYMIGNTDFSVIYGHNVVHLKQRSGQVSVVPYDFDFSGLVNAEYAVPPPELNLRNVKERRYRGFCSTSDAQPSPVRISRALVDSTIAETRSTVTAPAGTYEYVSRYLDEFFAEQDATQRAAAAIIATCRPVF